MSFDLEHFEEDRPCICRAEKSVWAFVADLFVFAILAFVLLAIALHPPVAKGDQEISAKPGRLKKITTTLDGKKILWRGLGDFDVIEDSSGKHATTLFPKPGTYQIFVVTAKADEPLTETITVKVEGDVPVPPEPGPGPKPPSPDNPPPIPGDGLRVLMVYESAKTNEPGNLPLFSKRVRDYLDEKCARVNGEPERRIYDKDIDTSRDSKTWQDAMKRPRTATPWLIISNGKTGFEGPLPPSVEATLDLLKKFGG